MRFRGRVSVKLLKTGPIRIDYLDHSQGESQNESGGKLVVTTDGRERDRDACDDAHHPEHGGS